MCGRARCSLSPEQVAQATGTAVETWKDKEQYHPSYNLSPGHTSPVLKSGPSGERELQTMTWGLVPSFTKPGEKLDHWKMFNARSETVDSKSVFSRLLRSGRCVVVVNGFYEWLAEGKGKQPYYVHFGESDVLLMAGLYDCYRDVDGSELYTYTILTTDSSSRLSWLHNRMPVLLHDAAMVEAWLGEGKQQQQDMSKLINQVCIPFNGDKLKWHPVTPAVSKPSYNAPDCSQDIRQKKGAISSFFKPAGAAKLTQRSDVKNTDENGAPSAKCEADTPPQAARKPAAPAAGKPSVAAAAGAGSSASPSQRSGEKGKRQLDIAATFAQAGQTKKAKTGKG